MFIPLHVCWYRVNYNYFYIQKADSKKLKNREAENLKKKQCWEWLLLILNKNSEIQSPPQGTFFENWTSNYHRCMDMWFPWHFPDFPENGIFFADLSPTYFMQNGFPWFFPNFPDLIPCVYHYILFDSVGVYILVMPPLGYPCSFCHWFQFYYISFYVKLYDFSWFP